MHAADNGLAAVLKLLLADKRLDLNMTTQQGATALIYACLKGHAPVVALLLADERVDPNVTTQSGYTALTCAAGQGDVPVVELLLADHRTIRIRPDFNGEHYDLALFNVKYARHARFKGLVRAVVAFRRMRLRAAEAVYAPGGAGFAAAAASFNAAVAATSGGTH